MYQMLINLADQILSQRDGMKQFSSQRNTGNRARGKRGFRK